MPAPIPPSDEVREQHVRNLLRMSDQWATAYRDQGPAGAVTLAAGALDRMTRADLILLVFGGVAALGTAQRVLRDIDPDLLEAVTQAIEAEAR